MAGPKQAGAGRSAGQAGGKPAAQRGRPGSGSRPGGKGAGTRPAAGDARGGRQRQAAGPPLQRPPSGVTAGEAGGRASPAAAAPRWLQLTTFILSLAGLGLSVYLTITHYTDTAPAGCPANATFNCVKVTTSPESVVFGIFPVAVLGLAFYLFMVAINSPWAWRSDLAMIRWARLAGVLTGIAFVLYLVYVELLKVDAICEYCTGVHVITFVLFGLIMYSAATAGAPRATAARR